MSQQSVGKYLRTMPEHVQMKQYNAFVLNEDVAYGRQ